MTPKVFIHDSYLKKDGTAAIYILVHLHRKTIKFNTNISCTPKKFDYKKHRIKGSTEEIKDDNLVIENALSRINEIAVRYRLQNETLTPELLKREWKNPAHRINFHDFLKDAINERKTELAESSIEQHKSLAAKLEKFSPALSFAEIDAEFINQFRLSLVKKENNKNTIHNNLKNFKAYMNIAKRKGTINENPFDFVKLKRAQVERVFLTEKELELFQAKYDGNYYFRGYHLVLRHFLFMCYTGLRISDFKELTFDNIIDDMIVYWPKKTKNFKRVAVKVPLTMYSKQLIIDEGNKIGKVFNSLSEPVMNRKLKDLSSDMKFYKKITNHSARHTFATLYIEKTNDVAGLQRLLGHSSITETMVYVHITETALQNQMKSFEKRLFQKEDKKEGNSAPEQRPT